jgi:hypothetical protein
MTAVLLYIGKRVSSRRSAIRAGNRAGLLAGRVRASLGDGMSLSRAQELAATHVVGPPCGPWPVPMRWRSLYERAFVKVALLAASRTSPSITVSSKYGVV